MDWKKEKISASELEKRRKEYMDEVMAMMKRGGREVPPSGQIGTGSGDVAMTVSDAVQTASDEEMSENAVGTVDDAVSEPADDNNAEKDADTAETAVPTGSDDMSKVETTADTAEKAAEREISETDGKYGVYTADDLLKGEYEGEGLKKAAEILEEMTRSTAVMKKLVREEESDDGDTVDFPDFSCPDNSEGERFRETAKTDEETDQSDISGDEQR